MDLMLSVESDLKSKTEMINSYMGKFISEAQLPAGSPVQKLRESVAYSAASGGKRFRPLLTLLTGEMLGASAESTLPFAASVEMIHSYSLIHDDLPCMDNDDERRGMPTNHKVFGEAMALLAGDALLTQSFGHVLDNYSSNSFLAVNLSKLLIEASGWNGMIAGQALDILAPSQITMQELQLMHELKTGAMIRVAVEGAAHISGAKPSTIQAMRKFGALLGLAFQIADDILDQNEKLQDGRSYVSLLGLEEARAWLEKVSHEALQTFSSVGSSPALEYLVQYNLNRKV